MKRWPIACVLSVAMTSVLISCGGDPWGESSLAKAMAEEKELGASSGLAGLFYSANLNDLHGEDGAIARALSYGEPEQVERRVRFILAQGGRKDLARSEQHCVALTTDRARVRLPASRFRRPLSAQPIIVSVADGGVTRVSTGEEMSLPVSSNEEIVTFASTEAARYQTLAAEEGRQLGALPEDLELWTLVVGPGSQWTMGGSPVERTAVSSHLAGLSPGGAPAVLVMAAVDCKHRDVVAALDQLAQSGVVTVVGLAREDDPEVVWAEIAAEDRPLGPRTTVALKADGDVRARIVHGVLRSLLRARAGSVNVLTRLDVEDRSADRKTYPGAVPAGIELLLLPKDARKAKPKSNIHKLSDGYRLPASITERVPRWTKGCPIKKPKRISGDKPIYAEAARRAGIEGTVVLELYITKDGDVERVGVIHGLRLGLTENASDAAKKWKYRPAELDGKPVDVIYEVEVPYKLR
jgi:TonB family protein